MYISNPRHISFLTSISFHFTCITTVIMCCVCQNVCGLHSIVPEFILCRLCSSLSCSHKEQAQQDLLVNISNHVFISSHSLLSVTKPRYLDQILHCRASMPTQKHKHIACVSPVNDALGFLLIQGRWAYCSELHLVIEPCHTKSPGVELFTGQSRPALSASFHLPV